MATARLAVDPFFSAKLQWAAPHQRVISSSYLTLCSKANIIQNDNLSLIRSPPLNHTDCLKPILTVDSFFFIPFFFLKSLMVTDKRWASPPAFKKALWLTESRESNHCCVLRSWCYYFCTYKSPSVWLKTQYCWLAQEVSRLPTVSKKKCLECDSWILSPCALSAFLTVNATVICPSNTSLLDSWQREECP